MARREVQVDALGVRFGQVVGEYGRSHTPETQRHCPLQLVPLLLLPLLLLLLLPRMMHLLLRLLLLLLLLPEDETGDIFVRTR